MLAIEREPRLSLRSSLQGELVDRIEAIVRASSREGDLLREAALARDLGVSRSPIRAALRHLVSEGVLEVGSTGGYTVVRIPPANTESLETSSGNDRLYGLLIRDIILSELEEPISESALMRRYGVGRGELTRVLRRLVREGLAEPLPGRGWSLLAFSNQRLSQSYHLRIILEPAMIADPAYAVDREVLERLRADHEAASRSFDATTPWQQIFDLDARFHEALAAGTANEVIFEIVRRENGLRRLAEYVGYLRMERTKASMAEHIAIIDALLAGNVAWAAALLRQHLVVSREETDLHFARDLNALRSNTAEMPNIL